MKKLYKRVMGWSLPTRLGLLFSIIGLIWGGTIFFGDKKENKFAKQIMKDSVSGIQIQTENMVINQSIPKPEIDFIKTESAVLITNNSSLFGIVGLGLKGKYVTVYKLSVRSVYPISRITIYTEDEKTVIWAINKINDVGQISNLVDGPMSSKDIINAKDEYVIAVATTTGADINLKIR